MGRDATNFDVNLQINGDTLVRESIPGRDSHMADLAALTTQVMLSVSVPALAGDLITNISFQSGATAAGTPTNWWFALYDPSGTLIAQTADQLTAAWAANTKQTLALTMGGVAQPQLVKVSGIHYAAIMVKATTPPSLVGISTFHVGLSTGFVTGQKALAQTSGAALTGTAPATIATPTAVANRPYCTLS
jgi:hypothetical protein